MNFETPTTKSSEEPEEKGLNLEEAQEEALIMQVKLKEMFGHEPTSQDYDTALKVIEEMKEAAENEPEFLKVVSKVMRIADRFGFNVVAGVLDPILGFKGKKIVPDLHRLDDAQARLEELKAKAEKLADSK